MLPASLVRIAVEKCILSTIKVPTVWNTSSQIIKKNNTTTQKKASGWFSPMLFLLKIKSVMENGTVKYVRGGESSGM